MTITNEVPSVERPAFFDGQRLTAADLTAVQDYQRELRWLHNRSLHTWGIAFGLEVIAKRGDRAVTVQMGYALDCLGRDLILITPLNLPIPPVPGSNDPALFYLTLSYLEDEDLPPEIRQKVNATPTGQCGCQSRPGCAGSGRMTTSPKAATGTARRDPGFHPDPKLQTGRRTIPKTAQAKRVPACAALRGGWKHARRCLLGDAGSVPERRSG